MATIAGLLLAFAPGQEPQEPHGTGRDLRGLEQGRLPGVLEWPHASGDWGGIRPWLQERGVLVDVFLVSDASVVLGGGADTGSGALRMLLDATLTLDLERLLDLPGGKVFADYQLQRGEDGSGDTGDLQAYSNIDGEDRSQLALLWYEQVLFDDALRVKVGKADANTDFAFVEHGFRFIHSSFGYSPTIVPFPTYPDPAFGALAFLRTRPGLYLGAGVYDGALASGIKTGRRGPQSLFGDPADLFLVGEAGWRWGIGGELQEPGPARLAGRLALGAWRHNGDFPRFDGGSEDGTAGFYMVLEQDLWKPPAADDPEAGIGGFLQYGWADPAVSAFEHHVGLGVTWIGPWAARPHDAAGLGLSWVGFSDEPGAGFRSEGELAIELFYTFQLTPWFRLKPDLQWIADPGGSGVDDALVFTLRTAVSF